MFNPFKKRPAAPPQAPQRTPRAVLPTYVTDKLVVLSKVAPTIRNTYEIRLALFMAKSRNLQFVLAVRPGTKVEASIRDLLAEHGGAIEEAQLSDYCVYFGWGHAEGEKEGWVLGDAAALAALVGEIRSPHLRGVLRVGASIKGAELPALEAELRKESWSARNIDQEAVQEALLTLVADARKNDGTLFVQ